MPKITDRPKYKFISMRVDQKDIDDMDAFYSYWQIVSKRQLRFKRASVLRLALDHFLKFFDYEVAYMEGNAYVERINAREFTPLDMFEVFQRLEALRDEADEEGVKYLYNKFHDLLHQYHTDLANFEQNKDNFYQTTQRLFVRQPHKKPNEDEV